MYVYFDYDQLVLVISMATISTAGINKSCTTIVIYQDEVRWVCLCELL